MTRRLFVCTWLLALPLAAYGEDKTRQTAAGADQCRFREDEEAGGHLAGCGRDGKPTDQVVSIIKVTAGGSAVHETIFPGQPEEMVSVYTVDGPDLVMTHYCVLGNQPRMKADPNSPANQIRFQFAGGANLDPTKDKHMHSTTLTIVDDDHIEIAGVGWQDGGPTKDMCCGMKLVRKK